MCNNQRKPHKHAELIKAWADGAEIEFLQVDVWKSCSNFPRWDDDTKYRVKPKPKVKKWRWVTKNKITDALGVTGMHIRDESEVHPSYYPVQKIDSTMIEVEE